MAKVNTSLRAAKHAKTDEFYTQFSDIQKEIEAYLEYDPDTFKNKVVYSNCDDPFESNFFRYFVLNFNRLGLKRLIATSYKSSPIANTQLELFGDDKTLKERKGRPKVTANKFIINEVHDMDADGAFNLSDISEQLKANKNNEWTPLEGDGDFRSQECIELLKQSDIVVTNPPFSLFRQYLKQLFDYDKKFLIIGNMNAITYREVFPLLKENKMWLGVTRSGTGSMWFVVSDDMPTKTGQRIDENGVRYQTIGNSAWFTNLDHGRRHQRLSLMTQTDIVKFATKEPFNKYFNHKAIDVSLVKNIPSDYDGLMGVPITFLGKYNPEQFEIIGLGISNSGIEIGVRPYEPEHKKYRKEIQKRGAVDGDLYMIIDGEVTVPYARVLIKHRKAVK